MSWKPIDTVPKEGEVMVFLNGVIYQAEFSYMGAHQPICATTVPERYIAPSHWDRLPKAPGAATHETVCANPECTDGVVIYDWVQDGAGHDTPLERKCDWCSK